MSDESPQDKVRRLEQELAAARQAARTAAGTRAVRRGNRSPTAVWIIRRIIPGNYSRGRRAYQLRWVDPVSQTVRARSVATHTEARELREDIRQELRAGHTPGGSGHWLSELRITLTVFMAGKADETIAKTQASLQLLQDAIGDCRLEAIDRAALMRFRAARLAAVGRGGTPEKPAKLSPATLNKNLREISSALTYAVDARWLGRNPLIEWSDAKLKEPQRTARTITADQLRAVCRATPEPLLRVAWILALCQGMRRRDLYFLRWDAVHLPHPKAKSGSGGGVIEILNRRELDEQTKARRSKALPLHPWAASELAKVWKATDRVVDAGRQRARFPHVFTRPDGRRFTLDDFTRGFIAAARAAGLKATLHDLRRSFSTLARNAGVDKGTVQELGRWSDAKTMDGYYTGDVSPALRQAMDQIAKVISG